MNLTPIEGAGANDFYSDMSGAVWNPTTRRLWVCRNGPGGAASKFWALRESGSTFEVDVRNGNRGEWTGFGDLEGITLADYAEDTVYLMIEGEERIKEYDVSTYGTAVLRNDWNTSPYLPLNGGSGAEGIAFIPDSFLAAQGFVNSAGAPYTSQNGMGGLMFVAHQNGGRVYVFDLNRTNGTFTYVGAYRTNYSESCELAFDRSEGLLYIFHGADLNTTQVVRLSSTLSGGERCFDEVVTYGSPMAGNLEGIAIVPNDDCTPAGRRFFLTIDGGGANSLFMFNRFPCCISNPDADGDGVNDCNDDCPGTTAGTPVDSHGCACSQGDADGDGVNDCNDQCPNTPAGQAVNGTGCSCSQLDADGDGVNDCVDQCPNTLAGQPVNGTGCSCSQLDADSDGVNDCFDQCPNTPAGQAVNGTGCSCSQLDADGDGVNDCNDQCPNTPAGQAVNGTGCSCSQLDADRDGVNDCNDQCPNSPPGIPVNAGGCACTQSDVDGDGVSDCDDLCPNTPAGQPVNGSGCSCSQLDTDRDGVNDCVDACPLSEQGLPVDASGCNCAQSDHDADGVVDCDDLCPGTSPGSDVDPNGCACSQKDSDADSVNDCLDECPDSIAGLPVGSSGCNCTQLDGDGDGVNDCDDLCPNTPAGMPVDEYGCASAAGGAPEPQTYVPAAISGEAPNPVVTETSGGDSSGGGGSGGGSGSAVAGEAVSQPAESEPKDESPLFFPLGGLCGLGALEAMVLTLAALGLVRLGGSAPVRP